MTDTTKFWLCGCGFAAVIAYGVGYRQGGRAALADELRRDHTRTAYWAAPFKGWDEWQARADGVCYSEDAWTTYAGPVHAIYRCYAPQGHSVSVNQRPGWTITP